MKQKIEMITEPHYDDLVDAINKKITDLEDTFCVQQIDYFCMSDTDPGDCAAFILFREKYESKKEYTPLAPFPTKYECFGAGGHDETTN